MKIFVGFIIAFLLGVTCRLLQIPLPAPPNLLGALLVLTITFGYLFVDFMLFNYLEKNSSHA